MTNREEKKELTDAQRQKLAVIDQTLAAARARLDVALQEIEAAHEVTVRKLTRQMTDKAKTVTEQHNALSGDPAVKQCKRRLALNELENEYRPAFDDCLNTKVKMIETVKKHNAALCANMATRKAEIIGKQES